MNKNGGVKVNMSISMPQLEGISSIVYYFVDKLRSQTKEFSQSRVTKISMRLVFVFILIMFIIKVPQYLIAIGNKMRCRPLEVLLYILTFLWITPLLFLSFIILCEIVALYLEIPFELNDFFSILFPHFYPSKDIRAKNRNYSCFSASAIGTTTGYIPISTCCDKERSSVFLDTHCSCNSNLFDTIDNRSHKNQQLPVLSRKNGSVLFTDINSLPKANDRNRQIYDNANYNMDCANKYNSPANTVNMSPSNIKNTNGNLIINNLKNVSINSESDQIIRKMDKVETQRNVQKHIDEIKKQTYKKIQSQQKCTQQRNCPNKILNYSYAEFPQKRLNNLERDLFKTLNEKFEC